MSGLQLPGTAVENVLEKARKRKSEQSFLHYLETFIINKYGIKDIRLQTKKQVYVNARIEFIRRACLAEFTQKQIAKYLNIKSSTVSYHFKRSWDKIV